MFHKFGVWSSMETMYEEVFLPRKKWSMVLCVVFLGFLERQGDPLSLFLFTIVVGALSALLARATDIGMIRGFEAS